MKSLLDIVVAVTGGGAAAGVLGQIAGGLGSVAIKAGTAAAAVAALAVAFTKQAIGVAADAKTMAERVNVSTESFSGLQYATGLANVSASDLQSAFRGLSEWATKAGRDGEDLNELFIEQVEVLSRIPEGAERIAAANDRFGRSAQNLLPIVKAGVTELRAQIKEAKEFGQVISSDFGNNADRFNSNLERMGKLVSGVFLGFADKILPDLIKFSNWVIDTTKSLNLQTRAVEALEAGYNGLKKVAGTVGGQAAGLWSSAYKLWDNSTTAMGSLIHSLRSGMSVTEAIEEASADLAENATRHADQLARIKALGNDVVETNKEAEKVEKSRDLSLGRRIREIQFLLGGEEALNKAGDIARLSGERFDAERKRSLEFQLKGVTELIELTQKEADERARVSGIELNQSGNIPQESFELQKKLNDLMLRRVTLQASLDAIDERARALSTSQAEFQIKKQQLEVSRIEGDNQLRIAEKRRLVVKALQEQLGLYPTLIAALIAELEAASPEEKLRIEERINRLLAERLAISGRIRDTQPQGFIERLSRGLDQLWDKWGQIGSNMADVMVNGVGTSLGMVADQLANVIDGTQEWQEAFARTAKGIVRDIINVSLQWMISRTVTAGLERVFGTERRAAAKQELVLNTANAAASSGSSWGVSAILGLAAFLALMGAVAGFAGAFADGGTVRGPGGPRGDRILAQLSDGEEVTSAGPANRFRGLLKAINSGATNLAQLQPHLPKPDFAARGNYDVALAQAGGGGMAQAPVVNVPPPQVQVMPLHTDREIERYMRSPAGAQWFRDQLSRNRGALGIPS